MSVDIWIWILDFAEFGENIWCKGIYLRYKFEQFIIWKMFQCEFPNIRTLIGGTTVEPYIEDQSFEEQHVHNQEQHDHSSK